ncbi:hypothetical protein MAR_005642 [Mya arenaria]|uniref:Death domain-containing protein n=1 Tax=Mya arenaria TaxID=6604 RepID=A0ABY7F396_MYAAR|nr:hypothetical protein MAR_005642 [Mya arenaria]
MANMYRLIIVGHNLESKCEIANALVKHKGSFKTLSCRTKPLVKALKNLTLLGNQASCHVTPNLNTPGWEYSVPAIKGFNSKIFLYVIFRGNVDVDDDSSFKYVQKTFTNPKIIPVVYCQTKLIAAGLGSAYINYLKIHGDMGFQSKCEIGERVLQKVNEAIKTETPQWKMTSDFYIPSKTYRQPRPTPHTSPPVEQIEIDTDKIQVKEEGKPLPDLREEDWLMFYKAMVRGQARSNHIRVNVVGNQGVGKTTLVRRLQGKKTVCPDRRQAPTEALDIDENICHCVQAANGTEKQWETNLFGIDDLNVQRLAEAMSNLTAKSEGSDRSSPYEEDIFDEELLLGSDEIVEIEDVTSTATQNQYYEAAYKAKFKREQHKLILQQAKRRRECGLSSQFWTSSISAFTSDESNGRAPIVLVGTHGDKISDEDAQKKFKEVRAAINMERVECLKIDNTLNAEYSPSDLEDLRNTLLELGLGISDEWVPAKWLDLEDALHQQKVGGKHRDDPELSNEPSPKQLARLAKFLRKEDSTSLGRLVDLNTASIEQVRNDHIDTSMQLLQILLKWKGRMVRRTPTLQLLVKILTRTGDYEVGDIKGALLDEVQTYEFDLQPTVLSKPPSQRTMMTVSSHVGSVYPLILLELGLELPSIQQSKYNNPNNMRGVIFELLDKWQQRYTDTATLQRLLSVMKHYETPTDNVVKCLASMTSEQAMSER